MVKKRVIVTLEVKVTVDESKFTPDFMQNYRDNFYDFNTIEEHIEHIGQMTARGIINDTRYEPDLFIEGYGLAKDMGIQTSFDSSDCDVELDD